MEQENRRSS